MNEDTKDPRPDDVQPSQNPEGEPRDGATTSEPDFERGISGDEAEAAGDRATADQPVSRDEVIDQSAYKDESADPGAQAADSERHGKE